MSPAGFEGALAALFAAGAAGGALIGAWVGWGRGHTAGQRLGYDRGWQRGRASGISAGYESGVADARFGFDRDAAGLVYQRGFRQGLRAHAAEFSTEATNGTGPGEPDDQGRDTWKSNR